MENPEKNKQKHNAKNKTQKT